MPISLALGKPLTGLVLAGLAGDGDVGRVADVGPGAGVYAQLFRALTPGAEWHAIEAWAPYVEKYRLAELYDQVHVADARRFDFAALGGVDVTLFGDVLEHMSAAEARTLLTAALARSRVLALSVPIGHWPQDEIEGNPFEVHVEDHLSHADIQSMVPGLCAGQAYVDADGKGIGIYFAAAGAADQARLAHHTETANRTLAEADDTRLGAAAVDFLDAEATAAFRDVIAAAARAQGNRQAS